jgi:hypothetical protein
MLAMGAAMRAKLFVLSVSFLFAASLCARAQSLEGVWVTVLDVKGIVYPHLEELRIARDGNVITAIYGIRHLPECEDKPPVQAGPCAVGQTNVTGQVAVDNAKGTIAVNAPTLSGTAMRGIGNADDERLAHELFWFGPGSPWTFRREANALAMWRRINPIIPGTVLDGSKAIVIEKQFHVVDAAFAGDLVAFAAGGEYSLVKMACIMPFISGDAGPAREFRTLMRDVAAVSQKRDELLASMRALPSLSPDASETLIQVMSTLRAANGAPSTKDIAATATVLGVTAEQVERFVHEIAMRPQAESADALLFSMLKPQEAEIRACHKQYFE